MALIFGVDISSYQAGIDLNQVAREGYDFCFVKATEGDYTNPYFVAHIAAARGAGMIPGAYCFLRAGDGAWQARRFVDVINAAGGPDGMVVFACDNEADAGWQTTVDFFAELRRLIGDRRMQPMYSGFWWWSSRGWNGAALTPFLWDSIYVSGAGLGSELYAQVPDSWWTPRYGGWSVATVLQFSSTARVAGYLVDVNAFRGTREELMSLAGGTPMVDLDAKVVVSAESGPTSLGNAWLSTYDDVHRRLAPAAQALQTFIAEEAVRDGVTDGRLEEADQALDALTAGLAALAETAAQIKAVVMAAPAPQPVVLDEQTRMALAADIAGLLAPQFGAAQQAAVAGAKLVERLGAAGDVIGTLNDG